MLALLVFAMMVVTANRPTAKGVEVFLPSNFTFAKISSPFRSHILLHIRSSRPNIPVRVYVNDTLVDWAELPHALKAKLKQQPEWVVYLDADAEVSWQAVMDGVSAIRESGAKTVLLTSRIASTAPRLY